MTLGHVFINLYDPKSLKESVAILTGLNQKECTCDESFSEDLYLTRVCRVRFHKTRASGLFCFPVTSVACLL